MSKFRIVDGANVTSIAEGSREIRLLEMEIDRIPNLTDRDKVVYAYHFLRLGNFILAQKYLNRLDSGYFDSGIFKDLFKAVLAWTVTRDNPALKTEASTKLSEYFLVVKRAVVMFEDVNFQTKPAFYRFKKQFLECGQVIEPPKT